MSDEETVDNARRVGRWALPRVTIASRELELRLTGWPLVFVGVSLIVLVGSITYNVFVGPEGWPGVIATGFTVILPIVISLLMAPRQISEDHSKVAKRAVRDLQDLLRSQETIAEDLDGIDLNRVEYEDRMRIVKSRGELTQQYRLAAYSAGYWREISPTVVDDVVNEGAEVLADMEKLRKSEDQL